MNHDLSAGVSDLISENIGAPYRITSARPLSGGCINRVFRVDDGETPYVVKLNTADALSDFAAERIGLLQLGAAKTPRVPLPIAVGTVQHTAVLVLTWHAIQTDAPTDAWRQFGKQLASLHGQTPTDLNRRLQTRDNDNGGELLLPENKYGGILANTTLSRNHAGYTGLHDDWAEFFCAHRLQFQFRCAHKLHGKTFRHEDQTLRTAATTLPSRPAPSLLHGDLWCGNASFIGGVEPFIYDPAVYVGDADADLAMTELFGGFPPSFYAGYEEIRPIPAGYRQRRTIYNLYHVVNHYNLFGGHYQQQAEKMMEEIINDNMNA